ncbi:NnrS family protein [uncultured Neptuniibacter sp.]|uniref:NnrS family protein n=1 Tax=uncultured Neptuniibacter sp. TaxID=502143 RepID=UPI0026184368|nr:NnrS family protein [uncultured Neptuniibacter sp.]
MIQLQERRQPKNFSLFNLGFRPFFLGGAIASLIIITLWLVIYSRGMQPHYYSYGVFWHAHEMIFGFTLAIIGGFLLTAVRNWTNVQTLYSWPLAALFLLWLTARALPLFDTVPGLFIATADLAFAPLLAISVAWPIIRSKNYRNLLFIPLIAGFFIANLLIHLQLLKVTTETADIGIQLGLFLVVMVITVLGGRVIPFFTERGVAGVSCKKYGFIEKAILPATALWVIVSLSGIEQIIATLSLIIGCLNLVRVSGWFNTKVLNVPLVWILQFGYLCIGFGFVLFGLSELGLVSRSIAYHAFAVGGIGGLTLGMMARVSLGHTGRQLETGPIIIAAFVLMVLSAIVRVAIGYLPIPYLAGLHLSGSLWVIAWSLFVFKYTPILIKPRLDGVYG